MVRGRKPKRGGPMKRIAIAAGLCLASLALAQETKKPAPGAPAAAAQPKPMEGPPKPAPEMKQLDLFLGNWKCEGKMMASPMGKEHAIKSTVTGKADLDGFWVVVRVDE